MIDLVVSGGTAPYTYLWNTGATSEDLTGLTAGTYTVTVTDDQSCTDEATFTIEEPTTLEIDVDATVLTDADCNGAATGTIDLVVTGGTAPYTYLWNTGATSEDLSGLTAGTYTVTVTDDQGCTDEATFTIEEPTTLEIDVDATVLTDADCNGAATGTIDLVVTGGTAPYTYLWNTGATSEDLTGLTAGTYTVTVTDDQGCTDAASYTHLTPPTIEYV
ncbi:MAG: SprB repeat-containing protein [Lewinella sp.]|uniref:SprB repeat-containing protein n=1 Tax=Lewinella sp. TaxID=2004506 RepID=UPI003D6AE948